MKIILATQGSQGVVALRELFALGYSPSDLYVFVCKAGINEPLISYLNFNQMKFDLIGSSAEFDKILVNKRHKASILLSISWKYRFSNTVIEDFGSKAINLHPGLLPEYRGCFSTPWAIINNEKYTGFTYHLITTDFDEGPILLREEIEILNNDTSHSLNYRVMQTALTRLGKVLKMNNLGSPQVGSVRYYPNKLPYGGLIDPAWDDKKRKRFIRAMYFPPYEPAVEVRDGLIMKCLPEGIGR